MPESKTHTKIQKKIQQKENRLLREIKNTHRDREENTIKKKTDYYVKAKTHKQIEKKIQQKENRLLHQSKTHIKIEKKNNKKKTYCCVKIKTYTKIEKKKQTKTYHCVKAKQMKAKLLCVQEK